MSQRRAIRFPEPGRALWLLLALAIALLVGLTPPGAQARPVALLLHTLGRDLGALRVQLEQVVAGPLERGTAEIAFADVGDGGPGFHRQAMATRLRAAQRSAALLERRYRQDGDLLSRDLLQRLWLGLHALERQVLAMPRSPDAESLKVSGAAVEIALHELDQLLALLLERGAGAPPERPVSIGLADSDAGYGIPASGAPAVLRGGPP